MINRLKIDELLLFFILSIVFLFVSFGRETLFSATDKRTGLVTYFKIEHALSFTAGDNGEIAQISVHDPSVDIFYSVNGGQTFLNAGNVLNLRQVENPDLTGFAGSFYHQPPLGDLPSCKSVVLKLKNTFSDAITEPAVYTFLPKGAHRLPVICLTAVQDDLFSDDSGLMVFGNRSHNDQGFYKSWWYREGNFTGRGQNWERLVFFQYFENDELKAEQFCGLRISGNATRGFPQKSMRIMARKTYGNDRFQFPFFGSRGRKKYTSLTIRNSGNDNTKTLFADLLMQRLAEGAEVMTLQGQPVVVYINGNYWGIYNLRERIDEYLLAKTEDVKEEDVTILEGADADLKEGSEKEQTKFKQLIERIDQAGVVDARLYDDIEKTIHVRSFMDYIFFETFYANNDWPANNATWYKAGEKKWKWILNDLDYSLAYPGPDNVNSNQFESLKKSEAVTARLFNKLMTNDTFVAEFCRRCLANLDDHFQEERINEAADKLEADLRDEMNNHVLRWRAIPSVVAWENNCEFNLRFLLKRRNIYRQHITELCD